MMLKTKDKEEEIEHKCNLGRRRALVEE